MHTLNESKVKQLPRNLALENIVFRFQEIQSANLSKSKSLDLTTTNRLNQEFSLHSDSDLPVFSDDTIEDSRCGMCEEGKRKAEWFCQRCCVLYCQTCLDTYHPRRGSLAHHKIRRPSKKEIEETQIMSYCLDHAEEQTTIFCNSCKVLVCHLCVCQGTGNHAGHTLLDVDTAWSHMKVCCLVCLCML